jgi:hypothetical protein
MQRGYKYALNHKDKDKTRRRGGDSGRSGMGGNLWWEYVRHLLCRYFTSHGHMPGHWHWWCLLYYVAVCGVWCGCPNHLTEDAPFVYGSRSFLPLPGVSTGPSQIPGRKASLPHHHSFHGFVAYCMTLEHEP